MQMISKIAFFCSLGLGVVCTSGSAVAESVFTGSVDNSWSEPANWDPNGVPTAADDVSIPAGKSVVALGDITCHDLSLAGSLTLGADLSRTQDPAPARPNVSLTASGDIVLSGAATLTVYAGQLEDMSPLAGSDAVLQAALYAHANFVSAAGTMTFGSGTTVKPGNDYISGTPVIFRATDITVAAGATVDADAGGWSYFKSTETPDPAVRKSQGIRRTYAPGYGESYSTGGAYGGAGGWWFSFADRTYGFVFAPLMPGSPAGIQKGTDPTSVGGGTICLQASGTLTVRGSLLARGSHRTETGGTSGGGIWLCGDTVDYASAELISADGEGISVGSSTAAGGGGRIAVCEGMTPAELLAMAGGTAQGEAPVAIDLPNVSVKGGVNTASGTDKLAGGDGTAVYIVSASRFAHVSIKTPGVPELKMEGLSYEERILNLGETSVDVPAYAYLASDPNVRYSYDGYAVSNATQEVCAGDASVRHIVFTLVSGEGPYTVYLKWTNREVRHAYGSVPAEYGSFTLNGEDVGPSFADWGAEGAVVTSVIGFVPADGCTFVGWSGSYPRAHTLGNPATCTSSVAYGLVPRVTGCTAVGEAISWNGGEGLWDDAANWSGGKVPTLLDDVTIASGSVTVLESFAAKSLTLSGGTLTVGETGSNLHTFGTVADDVILSGTAVLKAKAARPLSIDKTSQQAHQSSLYDQADTIRIGGALQVGSGARIEIANDPLTGLPVIFRTGSLTVAEGGTVTADGAGFSWVQKTDEAIFEGAFTANFNKDPVVYATFGYGRGPSPSYNGAGYGGQSKSVNKTTGEGCAYGFETAPLLPGSPCGIYTKRDVLPCGGGTVCVFAEGAVAVDGTVSALGEKANQNGGSSGGAIWLAGTTVSLGAAAVVTAEGQQAGMNSSSGGGGRILFSVATESGDLDALVDGATPEALGLVKTAISATQVTVAGGINTANRKNDSDPGTNRQVYDGVSHVVTVVGGAYGSVAVNGTTSASGAFYWVPEGETDTLTAVPAAGCEFVCWRGDDVPRNLCRTPTLVVSATKAANVQAVFAPVSAEPTACHWKESAIGDWYDAANWEEGRVPGSSDEAILASGQITADSALVVGSLIVSNGAALTVRDCREVVVVRDLTLTSANSSLRIVSLPTDEENTWTNGATRVNVGGTFLIDDQATLYPESDGYTGGSPVFLCGAFFLAEDAKVDAVKLGFGGEIEDLRQVNLCPGGSGYGNYAGGGYGGLGGTLSNVEKYNAGRTYGLALSPIHPGAPNGVINDNPTCATRGSGLVRIHAGQMTVNGTIDVSGFNTWPAYGGPSGGGIWLTCEKRDELSFGSSAKLLAKGGYSMYYQAGKGFSAGGGGRIAVGVNLTEADRLAMIEAGAFPGKTKKHVFDREAFESLYPGVTINVQPGHGDDPEKGWSDDPAYSGSFNFVDGRKFGLMLLLR